MRRLWGRVASFWRRVGSEAGWRYRVKPPPTCSAQKGRAGEWEGWHHILDRKGVRQGGRALNWVGWALPLHGLVVAHGAVDTFVKFTAEPLCHVTTSLLLSGSALMPAPPLTVVTKLMMSPLGSTVGCAVVTSPLMPSAYRTRPTVSIVSGLNW